jgi:hypothetical protein
MEIDFAILREFKDFSLGSLECPTEKRGKLMNSLVIFPCNIMVELSAVATLVTVSTASVIAIISQIQHSRCTQINFCCFSCTRKVPDVDEPEVPSS